MQLPRLIDQAQAKIHARNRDWTAFNQSIKGRDSDTANTAKTEWLSELWFEFALGTDCSLLVEFSQWLIDNQGKTNVRLPALATLIDAALKEPTMQRILDDSGLHEVRIAGTIVPVPNKGWRARQHVFGDWKVSYADWMRQQPEHIQCQQKEYLIKYGRAALRGKPLLYYAICAFGEPSKEDVCAVALADNPIYDVDRLEVYYPGIGGMKAACEGMGLTKQQVQDELKIFMGGEKIKPDEILPENGFDAC